MPSPVDQHPAEPVAIVGLACRLPGAPDPAALWRLLKAGGDAISDVPIERWDGDALYDADLNAPGKTATRRGGFLDQVDGFDAAFFGISPREAEQMDPQQRLMLELSWEAMEDAGVVPADLEGSATGVYFGAMWDDYDKLFSRGLSSMGPHSATGRDLSIIAARVSYVLGLRGPSITVCTACSSSLVAVHQACQSLRAGESRAALAGGVSLTLAPHSSVLMSKVGGMAPDGRCKTFDARADGYVRAEGGGVVLLKPLADALADHDPIYCVIRGSAVNNDGASNGLTAPCAEAQAAMLRDAYAAAGVEPGAVQYVEAHGTGTGLGDPTEARALGRVMGNNRDPARPLLVGSVKTNIGHLEAAAGVTGLIKTALALRHREIPANLNFQQPNPAARLEQRGLEVPTRLRPWPAGEPALAGVSSFGFGGTNCHVVLQGMASGPPREATDESSLAEQLNPRYTLLPVSARDPHALAARQQQVEAAWSGAVTFRQMADLAYTVAARRAHLIHRAAYVVRHGQGLPEPITGRSRPGIRPTVAFVFSGHGSQWPLMGADLLRVSPAFREAFARCAESLEPHLGWCPFEALDRGRLGDHLERVSDVQPVIFAVQTALAALWRHAGVSPDAVVGHSVGEVAAAHVAGALTLDDAARVICGRSRVLERVAGRGAMMAVPLPLAEAARAVQGREDEVNVAVINGGPYCVLAGEPGALDEVARELAVAGVEARRVDIDLAAHSPQITPLLAEMKQSVDGIQPRAPLVPMASSVTGELVRGAALDPGYWASNLRQPVRFDLATELLLGDGVDTFVEVSPHPLMLGAVEWLAANQQREALVVGTLRRGQPDEEMFLAGAARLWAEGCPLDPSALQGGRGRCVPLPPYPWQRRRYWPGQTPAPAWESGPSASSGGSVPGARYLDSHLESSVDGVRFYQSQLDQEATPVLGAHGLDGDAVVPAGVLLDMALCAGRHARGEAVGLRDVVFTAPVTLEPGQGRQVQLVLDPDAWRLSSRRGDTWEVVARGGIRAARGHAAEPIQWQDLTSTEPLCAEGHYEALAARGITYGGELRSVQRVFRQNGRVLVALAGVEDRAVLLDAGLQALVAALPQGTEQFVVARVGDVELRGPTHRAAWALASLHHQRAGHVTFLSADGEPLGGLRDVRLAKLPRALWTERWEPLSPAPPLPHPPTPPPPHWLVVGGPETLATALCQAGGSGWQRASSWDGEGRQVVLLDGAALDAEEADDPLESVTAACSRLVQARNAERVVVVTCNGVCVPGVDSGAAAGPSALHGLARVVREEFPGLEIRVVDVGNIGEADVAALCAEIDTAPGAARRVALRGGQRLVPRRVSWRGRPDRELPRHGTVLISGGLGAVGLQVACELAESGARDLLLLGRRPPDPATEQVMDDLRRKGARVVAAQADVTSPREMEKILTPYTGAGPGDAPARRLAAVIHCAGTVDDALLQDTDPHRLRRVLAPKVAGAWNLHRLTRAIPLEAFVLFGSVGGWEGLAGQGAYAAANAFLDGLAEHRRALGLPAVSIGWCGWRDLGFAATDGGRAGLASLEQRGVGTMSPAEALDTLTRVLTSAPPARLAVMPRVARPELPATSPAPWRQRIMETSQATRRQALLAELVRGALAAVLQLSAEAVDETCPMRDQGLDSMMAVELVERLNHQLGLGLPRMTVWQHPTLQALCEHLEGRLEMKQEPPPQPEPRGEGSSDPLDDVEMAALLEGLSDGELAALGEEEELGE